MEHALNEFSARARGDRADDVAFREHLERAYLASVCFNKHEAYAEEEEARMVFVEPPWPGFVHHRDGGFSPSGRTAYMEVAAAPIDEPDTYSVFSPGHLPVRRVRIGPRYGTDIKSEIDEIVALLHEHGYAHVEVTASSIPFRG